MQFGAKKKVRTSAHIQGKSMVRIPFTGWAFRPPKTLIPYKHSMTGIGKLLVYVWETVKSNQCTKTTTTAPI